MFFDESHKTSFIELSNDAGSFLNKGQLFVLAYSQRLYKLFFEYVNNDLVDWENLLADDRLTNDERVLFTLMRSFDDKESPFNTDFLYKIEDIGYLQLALRALYAHFALDVYPYDFARKSGESIIYNQNFIYDLPKERLISQKEIAEMWNLNGIPGDPRKVSVYKKKGYLPKPDYRVGNRDLWRESKIKEWIDDYKAGNVVKRRKRRKNNLYEEES